MRGKNQMPQWWQFQALLSYPQDKSFLFLCDSHVKASWCCAIWEREQVHLLATATDCKEQLQSYNQPPLHVFTDIPGTSFARLLNVLMFTSKVTVTKYFSPFKQDHLIDYKSHRFKDNSVSQFPVYLGCLWKRVCHIYVLWGLSVCSKGIT
jgi:hypothetical protein